MQGIVIDHGGSVWLESELGRGTGAYCLFPVLEGEAPEKDLAASDAAPGRGELVLFVDDEPSLAILGQRRLEALGYRVVAATDAADALATLRVAPERFDLVVTDYSMPGMSGLELAREIHAARADLPNILLTGYMEEFPAEDLAAAGVRTKAKKPISLPDLAAITRAVLDPGTKCCRRTLPLGHRSLSRPAPGPYLDGQLYIPTTAAMPGDGQNERLKEFAGQRVTVRGKAFAAVMT